MKNLMSDMRTVRLSKALLSNVEAVPVGLRITETFGHGPTTPNGEPFTAMVVVPHSIVGLSALVLHRQETRFTIGVGRLGRIFLTGGASQLRSYDLNIAGIPIFA